MCVCVCVSVIDTSSDDITKFDHAIVCAQKGNPRNQGFKSLKSQQKIATTTSRSQKSYLLKQKATTTTANMRRNRIKHTHTHLEILYSMEKLYFIKLYSMFECLCVICVIVNDLMVWNMYVCVCDNFIITIKPLTHIWHIRVKEHMCFVYIQPLIQTIWLRKIIRVFIRVNPLLTHVTSLSQHHPYTGHTLAALF